MADFSESAVDFWKRHKVAIAIGLCIAVAVSLATIVIAAVYANGSMDRSSQNAEDDVRIGALSGGPSPCSSGRLFVGSLNDHFAQHQQLTGIYVEDMDNLIDGRPRFKHETQNQFLRYDSKGIWMISREQEPDGIRIHSRAERPEMANGLWRVRFAETELFIPLPFLKVVCVAKSFRTCNSGKVLLSSSEKKDKMGIYTATDRRRENRQVFEQDNGTQYLYYAGDNWVIDKTVGRTSIDMFVDDYAARPEYIMKPWISFNGDDGFDKFNVTMKCVGKKNRNVVPRPTVSLHPKCVGAFYYNGLKQPGCTKVNAYSYWCSHTAVYEKRWSYCLNLAVTPHPDCQASFEYRDKIYNGCTIDGYDRYWCSTTKKFTGKWRLCIQ